MINSINEIAREIPNWLMKKQSAYVKMCQNYNDAIDAKDFVKAEKISVRLKNIDASIGRWSTPFGNYKQALDAKV